MATKKEQYEKILSQVALCEATGQSCVLIHLEVEGENTALNWSSATNSAYETSGMVSRLSQILNFYTEKDETKNQNGEEG